MPPAPPCPPRLPTPPSTSPNATCMPNATLSCSIDVVDARNAGTCIGQQNQCPVIQSESIEKNQAVICSFQSKSPLEISGIHTHTQNNSFQQSTLETQKRKFPRVSKGKTQKGFPPISIGNARTFSPISIGHAQKASTNQHWKRKIKFPPKSALENERKFSTNHHWKNARNFFTNQHSKNANVKVSTNWHWKNAKKFPPTSTGNARKTGKRRAARTVRSILRKIAIPRKESKRKGLLCASHREILLSSKHTIQLISVFFFYATYTAVLLVWFLQVTLRLLILLMEI